MTWMLILAATWALLSVPLALLVGRIIGLGDMRRAVQSQVAIPDFVPPEWTDSPADLR